MEDTANDVLVCVDMQNDFLLPDGKLYIGEFYEGIKEEYTKYVHAFKGFVIATCDKHKYTDIELTLFPPHCVEYYGMLWPEHLLHAIYRKCASNTIRIVEKKSYTNRNVVDALMSRHQTAKRYIFTGVCTHICLHDIISSFYHAMVNEHNIIPKIVILKKFTGDFDPQMAEFALKRMKNLYGVEVIE